MMFPEYKHPSCLDTLKVKSLHPEAIVPTRAHKHDAGLDLYADRDIALYRHEQRKVATGVAVSIPKGYAGLVCPRSGLSSKHGITVHNGPGIIDAGFTGELEVTLILDSNYYDKYHIRRGDRIAQLVVVPCWLPEVELVDELGESDRGDCCFGSSGK